MFYQVVNPHGTVVLTSRSRLNAQFWINRWSYPGYRYRLRLRPARHARS